MTALIEAIVWFCAGTAAGIAISGWFWNRIEESYRKAIGRLMRENCRLSQHIATLEKKRELDESDWWKEN